MEQVSIGGISYVVTRESEHPAFPGRHLVHLRRENGTRRYVATRYENGRYSNISVNHADHFADVSKMIGSEAA